MPTAATVEKLKNLAGYSDLSASEIRFVLKHWDDAPKRTQTSVINSTKELASIPAAVQVELVNTSDKAVRAIGELLCPEAQDLVLKDFKEDIPQVLKKCTEFKHISDKLWAYLAAKHDTLPAKTVNQLVARKDCPPKFAKALGLNKTGLEKEQRKARVKRTTPRRSDTVNERDTDDDFTDVRRVARAVRTTKRK